MPILFVHGVNTRKNAGGYDATLEIITQLMQAHFTGLTINGKPLNTVAPAFPYWGDLGTDFAWDMASLPSGREHEALGGDHTDEYIRLLIAAIADGAGSDVLASNAPLASLAKSSFPQAVEVVCDLLMHAENDDMSPADNAAAIIRLQEYAEANSRPEWINNLSTDAQFIDQLLYHATPDQGEQHEALGGIFDKVGNALRRGVQRLKGAVSNSVGFVADRAGDYASTRLLASNRKSLNGTLGRFFGDVFVYLDSRGDKDTPGEIPTLILDAIDKAVADAPDGEPLVIMAHSLGGVITFDLLSHYRPDLQVDLLITVGSQVSHFEEIKRFHVSDPSVPNSLQTRAHKPDNIHRWINVFDIVDIFSYACEDVFEDVEDFHYDTKTYVIKSHSAYYQQKRFYERLRERINPVS